MHKALYSLNETFAMPAGYVVTNTGSIVMLDRHRVKEFLGARYHSVEGEVLKENGVEYGLEKYPLCWGLIAIVFPSQIGTQVKTRIGYYKELARKYQWSLEDSLRRAVKSLREDEKWEIEYAEIIDEMVPTLVKEMENLRADRERTFLYQKTVEEEEFHARQNIAAALLTKRDVELLGSLQVSAALLRPDGMIASRDFLPSLAEHQNALQNDIAVSSIMESMYDFYELRHTDNPLYSIAEHLILVFMEIWTNKNAADEDALKRINRVSSQTTLYYLCRFLALLKKDKDIASLIKSADSRQLTQFTKEASESCLASNFYRLEEIEDLSKIGKFERAARLLSGFSPDERDERLRNATFTELVAFQSGLTPLEVKTVGVAAALADRRSAAGEGKPPAATQKPYSSEGLELAEIKARIGQQKPTRLSKDELVSLFGSLKPGTQTETTEFNLAFPDFRRQFEDISNILARAPPHIEVYQLERSLEDKDKLPVSAISYREDGTLKIFITPNNAPGLFHELYEHEILKGSSYDRTRHTLAAVAEGAFSDSILSQRAVGQLAEMAKRDKNLLEKFIATYNTAIDGEDSIIDQINEKFPDSPDLQGLRSYILAHAKAMHEEALKIREINAGIEAIVNECYDERAVEIRGRYGLSTDAVLVKKLEELFKQCLPGAAFDFHKYISSDSHFHKFYTTYCQTKESTRRALLRLWSIYRKYHRIVNLVNERLERHVGTDGPALEAIEFLVEGERSPMRCIQPTGFNPVTKLGINVESMFDESNDIFGIGDVAHEAGHALLKLVDNLGSLLEEDAEMAANWVAGQILDQREIEGYLANKVKVHFKFERGSIYCHTAAFLLAFARKAGIREDPPIIQELLRQAPSGLAAAYSRYYDALRWRSGQAAAKGRMGSDYSQAGAEIKTGDRNALLGIVLENPANYSIVDSTDTDECNAKAAEALAMLKRLAIVEKDLAAIIIEDTAATKGIVSEYDSLIVGGKTTAVTRFGQLAIMSRKYAAGNSIIDIALSIAHEDAASRKKQGQEAANAATAEKGPSGVGESFVIEACAAEFQHAAGCTAEARFLKRLGLKGAKALGIDRKAYEDLLRIKESGRIGAETVARVKNDAAESIWKRVSDGGLRESMKTVTGREYTASEWKTLARDLADVKTDYDACKAFGLDVKLKKQLSMMAQDMRRMIQEKKARGDKTFTLFAAGLGHEPLELITLLSTFYSELVLQEDEDPKEWDVRVYAVDAQKGPISNARRYFDNEGAVLNLTELDYGTGLGVEKKGTILLSRLKKLERFNIKYAAANVLDENAFDGSRPLFGEEAAPVSKTDYVVMRHVYYFDNYFNKRHATKDMGFMNNLTSADSAKSLEAAKSLLQYHTALRNLFYLARPTDSKTPTRLVIEPLERIIMNQRDYFPILLPPGTTATQHWGSGILEINDSAAISDIAAFHRSLRDDYLRERHAEFVQKVTESVAEAAKPPIADETPLYETLLKLLKNVRAPAKPRVFFIPVKDPAAREFHDARNALRRGFEKEDFKNVAMVFYDGTEEDLIRTYERERATPDAELNMPGTLALAYADSDRISGEALEAHNRSNPTFKWVREDLPEGVLRKDLFMHVAFGLSVLDYLANDADPEHREKLINLIEKMVANDAKEIVHIFTSKFVLKLKKIERINMEEKLKQHEMSIAKVLTAA
jgi:hypothetical protein